MSKRLSRGPRSGNEGYDRLSLLQRKPSGTDRPDSEHVGFAMLLKACFAAIRNPRAYEPKIIWKDDDDAADYLALISLLHCKVDETVRVPYPAAGA
ncbi:MAG: TIGR02391 family protein [Bacillota bacterium]|nr:TIGR02391 family protein [Bacillota bacterium]